MFCSWTLLFATLRRDERGRSRRPAARQASASAHHHTAHHPAVTSTSAPRVARAHSCLPHCSSCATAVCALPSAPPRLALPVAMSSPRAQEEKASLDDGSRPVLLHTVDSEESRSVGQQQRTPAAASAAGSPRTRQQAVEMQIIPPTPARSSPAVQDASADNEPLSEDEEEQIKMEAQVGMLLTAARSDDAQAGARRSQQTRCRQELMRCGIPCSLLPAARTMSSACAV
jgi:hypothetical protein